ncbi:MULTISPECIES: YcnI family protein [unclassified Haematobacter]|uniref:YcnI family protein n=1 Tax=unclassified Haematobacter TaxID=2640585 RepID=UPI0025C72C9E|nr:MULTISPECIES: YcnI family protein [unclassified Haematobacter]
MTLRFAAAPVLLPALLLAALPAAAHIHASPAQAGAGQTVEIALEVGHGCSGAATTALRVALPEGLSNILIAPRAGWQVETLEEGRVTEIRWSGGPLPDGTKQKFAFVATLQGAGEGQGARGGDLVLPVVQVCGETVVRWIDGPDSDHPAPRLRIAPGS